MKSTNLIVPLLLSLPSLSLEWEIFRPPDLFYTDCIQGNCEGVGPWGDGNIYILDFWGTWCSPCIKEIPHLTELQKKYRDRGLVVVGYSWESPDILFKFLERMGPKMGYVVVGDTTETTLQRYVDESMGDNGIQGFPYSYLISGSGQLVWRGNPKHIDRTLSSYLGE